jgi:hypothetical protein
MVIQSVQWADVQSNHSTLTFRSPESRSLSAVSNPEAAINLILYSSMASSEPLLSSVAGSSTIRLPGSSMTSARATRLSREGGCGALFTPILSSEKANDAPKQWVGFPECSSFCYKTKMKNSIRGRQRPHQLKILFNRIATMQGTHFANTNGP